MTDIIKSYEEKLILMLGIPIILLLNLLWSSFGFWFIFVWAGIQTAYLMEK